MTTKDFAETLSDSERRGADRKKLIVGVKFNGGDATGIANTRDIGIGGLYMTTNTRLDIGTPIFMKMPFGAKEFSIEGVVVYTEPGHGVGIRFQNLSEEMEAALRNELNFGS